MPSSWLSVIPAANIKSVIATLDPQTVLNELGNILTNYINPLTDPSDIGYILELICKRISTSEDSNILIEYKKLLTLTLIKYIKSEVKILDVSKAFLIRQGCYVTIDMLINCINTPSILTLLLEHATLVTPDELNQRDSTNPELLVHEEFNKAFMGLLSKAIASENPKPTVECLLDYLAARLLKTIVPSVYSLTQDHLPDVLAGLVQEYQFDTFTFKEAVTDTLFAALSPLQPSKKLVLMLLREDKYSAHLDFSRLSSDGKPLLMAIYEWMQYERLTDSQKNYIYQLPFIYNIDITTILFKNETLFTRGYRILGHLTDQNQAHQVHLANLLAVLYKQKDVRFKAGIPLCSSEELAQWTGLKTEHLSLGLEQLHLSHVSNLALLNFFEALQPNLMNYMGNIEIFLESAIAEKSPTLFNLIRTKGFTFQQIRLADILSKWQTSKSPSDEAFFIQIIGDFLSEKAEEVTLKRELIITIKKSFKSDRDKGMELVQVLLFTYPEYVDLSVFKAIEEHSHYYAYKARTDVEKTQLVEARDKLTLKLIDFLNLDNTPKIAAWDGEASA